MAHKASTTCSWFDCLAIKGSFSLVATLTSGTQSLMRRAASEKKKLFGAGPESIRNVRYRTYPSQLQRSTQVRNRFGFTHAMIHGVADEHKARENSSRMSRSQSGTLDSGRDEVTSMMIDMANSGTTALRSCSPLPAASNSPCAPPFFVAPSQSSRIDSPSDKRELPFKLFSKPVDLSRAMRRP